MSTTQVRITLPTKLKTMLVNHASLYGLSLASYIRHLLLEEVQRKEVFPTVRPSSQTLSAIKQGEKEYAQEKVKSLPIDDLETLADSL